MSAHCPACGSDVDVTPRAIEVEAGTCPGCSRAFLLLPANADLTTTVVTSVPGVEGEADDDEEELSAVCAECGGTLVLAVDGENALAATCDDCNTVFKLVRADAPERPSRRLEDAPERPSRSRDSDRGGDDRPFSPRREFDNAGGASRARPCRKCGGPIVFSDGEDGGMVGTCQSCGNRFSLRPRADGAGGGGGRDRGYSSGPRRGGPPPWKSRGGSGGYGGGGGSRRPRSDSGDDDRRPQRRRRRDD
jgi:DNA-directed RNA polymerase subunit M/transcription elongation factor TFIIS